MDFNQRLEYLYKEYARLSDRSEEQIKIALDDLKALGVVGASILLWKPILDAIVLTNSKINYSNLLFLGFIILLLTLIIILFWNLLKQFYIIYYIYTLKTYEDEIRRELNESNDSKVFRFNFEKETTVFFRNYVWIFASCLSLILASVIFIPFLILAFVTNFLYSFFYLAIAILVCSLYMYILRKSASSYFRRL